MCVLFVAIDGRDQVSDTGIACDELENGEEVLF